MGSYSVALQSGQNTVLSIARAVIDPTSTGKAYSFDTTVAGGQAYAFDLADFGYPAPFVALNAALIQKRRSGDRLAAEHRHLSC